MTKLDFIFFILLPSLAIFGILIYFLGENAVKRDTRLLTEFASLLDNGEVARPTDDTLRAVGIWKNFQVSIGFFGRLDPAVFLTRIQVRRKPSLFAALFVSREKHREADKEAFRNDIPPWIMNLERGYDADCAPREFFRLIIDEEIRAELCRLEDAEIEILPDYVNILRRKYIRKSSDLKIIMDSAVLIAKRLDRLSDVLNENKKEIKIHEVKVVEFLRRFQ
jgi:hypothetical protein